MDTARGTSNAALSNAAASDAAASNAAAGTVDVSAVVRARLRGLRVALGWSLDELASRSNLSTSTLSRIENGKRTIGLDVLPALCRALHVDIATLLDVDEHHGDVVIRPVASTEHGRTVWPLTRPDSTSDVVAAKWRLEPVDDRGGNGDRAREPRVHPGHDWFFVLDGTVELTLGERTIVVRRGEAAEFSTMTPHHIAALDGPAEILTVFDRTGHRAHHDDRS
jgi:transcriptional regulator with XRE-family HTH domain